MRTRTGWLALLLVSAGVALAPATGRAQEVQNYDVGPADPVVPLPLYHDRPEKGGFYAEAGFVLWRQTNPLKHQVIAERGFVDISGNVTGSPGKFVGSGLPALFADDAGGPLTYQPGWDITLGWRFESGVAIDVSWIHLAEAKYASTASLIPFNFSVGLQGEESFLTSPVFNFPTDFAGPPDKIFLPNGQVDNTGALFGIWNGATEMSIQFTQRFDQYDITGRIPIFEQDCVRCYGLVGPRIAWIWESFKWRTVSANVDGIAGQDDVALYSNMVSNRLWGVHCGGGTEWVLGNTPAGTFSFSLDCQAAGFVDIVREEAKYERGDFETSSKRAKTEYTFAPELEANASLWWYPVEGIQLRVGYTVMGFFNTISSPNPVSFNYGGLSPAYEHEFLRFFDGLNAGIAFIF